jgi:hypothetical protein
VVVTYTADGRFDSSCCKALRVPDRDVLAAAITVMDEAIARSAVQQRLLKSVKHEPRVCTRVDAQAQGAAYEGVDKIRRVDESRPRGHVGEVGHPQYIRARCLKLPFDAVEGSGRDKSPITQPCSMLSFRVLRG